MSEEVNLDLPKVYKKLFKLLCNDINSTLEARSWRPFYTLDKFTFKDVRYTDYFFRGGDNSVVEFHIKEIPKWLFGVWFSKPKFKKDGEIVVEVEFFTQYEERIDRFNPSNSYIYFNIDVRFTTSIETIDTFTGRIVDCLMFMHNEPELAYCRDCYGWNYNCEYHSREEAKEEFNKYLEYKKTQSEVKKYCDNEFKRVFKDILKSYINKDTSSIIYDYGKNNYPRYQVVINKDKCNFEDDGKEIHKFPKELVDKIKECEQQLSEYAREKDVYWSSNYTYIYLLVSDEEFKGYCERSGKKWKTS